MGGGGRERHLKLTWAWWWTWCNLLVVPLEGMSSTGTTINPHGSRSSISAVYTCIKKPESFSHSGFSFFFFRARQLPLNTKKKPRIEKPTSAAWFFETPPKFHWFFANVNARSNLAGIIRVFGHVIRDLQRNHPTAARDRNAHYTCTVKGREKSLMRTTYQNTSMEIRVFSRMRFSCQKPRMLWVFLAV